MHVHVVNSANRHQYLEEIEQMHRHRHRVFADAMGWKALASPDGLDIDEFDTRDATYLMAIDLEGNLCGSCRLIPTWRPHMLKDKFADYAEDAPPSGPGVWEWTRYAPGEKLLGRETNREVRLLLNIALHEFAISRGIETFVGIADCKLVPHLIDHGWKIVPVGLPVSYGEGVSYAYRMDVDAANNDRLRSRLGRAGTVLVEMPRSLIADESRAARRIIELAMSAPADRLNRAEEVLRQHAA
jgi:N-acyl-L-homoserine lactone synthetase